MIQMSMRQDDGIQLVESAFLGKAIVILYLLRALEEAKVKEDVCLSRLQEVGGPRDFASAGAMNGNSHFVAQNVLHKS
jgi:hypothetical protein